MNTLFNKIYSSLTTLGGRGIGSPTFTLSSTVVRQIRDLLKSAVSLIAPGTTITQPSNAASAAGLVINKTGTGSGSALSVTSSGSSSAISVVRASGSTAPGIGVTNASNATGQCIVITNPSTADSLEINQDAAGIGIDLNKTNTGAGTCLDITNAGTGYGILVTQTGAAPAIGVTAEIEFTEQTAPAAPAANKARLFCQDNGAGKTQLMVLFPSGAAQQIAIEP